MSDTANDNLVLICGKSATGKSASLMQLENPEGVMYLNCEHKKLPFKAKYQEYNITDPHQIYQGFDHAATEDSGIHTIIIDSVTYMMDMYETLFVLPHAGTKKGMSAWGDYAQFWKKLMNEYVANTTKNVICLAHTMDVMNESELINETLVKFKGATMNVGVESYFSSVIATKKVTINKLKDCKSDLLTITPEEEALGFKYVFQTKLTKDTVNERIRGSLGMWPAEETFIDNNAQNVLNTLHKYYS